MQTAQHTSQSGRAFPQQVTHSHWARMVNHGKGTIQTISFAYLKGVRKAFAVTDGFVPIDDQDVDLLQQIQANGEPPWRGGAGKPLFQVLPREEALKVLHQEHTEAILKGQGGGQGHAMLSLLGSMGASAMTVPPSIGQTFTPSPAPLPTLPEVSSQAAAPAPTGETPQLGRRRKGGHVAATKGKG